MVKLHMVELAGNTPASVKRRRYRTTSLVCFYFLAIERLNKPNVLKSRMKILAVKLIRHFTERPDDIRHQPSI